MSGTIIDYEAIKQAAMVRLPGIDPVLVDMEMQWAVYEFMLETRVSQRVRTYPLVGGLREYTLLLISDVEVPVVLIEANIDGRPLQMGYQETDTSTGLPTMAGIVMLPTLAGGPAVAVTPTPTSAESGKNLVVRYAYARMPIPSVRSQEMLVELRPYHSHLLDGLLARLLSMPDKPWTNSRAAGEHMRRFRQGITSTRREVETSRTQGSLRMRMPRFGV